MNTQDRRKTLQRHRFLERFLATLLAILLPGTSVWADATLPTGGTIISGDGSISQVGETLTIDQERDRMILHWERFDVGRDAAVIFRQPDSEAVALNRVSGHNPSRILGSLSANGRVFLINPSGIVFGEGAQVDVGALVASTLDIADGDFMAGSYRFKAAAGESGAVENYGSLSGAVVALVAPAVRNEGSIAGDAALAAGTDVVLDFDGDGLIGVQVPASTVATLVENHGVIETDGGLVVLTARGAAEAMGGIVNNTGVIRAAGLASEGDRILLLGDMRNGEVQVDGSLTASFIETSAAEVRAGESLAIDALGGMWLIDPYDITIDDALARSIEAVLSSGSANVTVSTDSSWFGGERGPGDIRVEAPITWDGQSNLKLQADRSIYINAPVTSTGALGSGGLTLVYGLSDESGDYYINAPVYLPAGDTFFTQKGTEAVVAYRVIHTVEELQAIENGGARNYALGAQIDASKTKDWNGGAGFAPITVFSGSFEGLGHSITGLHINRPEQNGIGLFSTLMGSVRNLTLSGSVAGNDEVGLLAGGILNGTVERVSLSTGKVTAWGKHGGGLTGFLSGGTVDDVHSAVNVEGRSTLGGLIGYAPYGDIRRSSASGSVLSYNEEAGGLVGVLAIAGIEDSFATGDVFGYGVLGGLVGRTASLSSSIARSYATGSVEAGLLWNPDLQDYTGYYVGGLVGVNHGSIEDSYATGSVSGHSRVGGLIGVNEEGTVRRVYATGSVDGNGVYASLVGMNSANGKIEEAYTVGETPIGSVLVSRNEGQIARSFALDRLTWTGSGSVVESRTLTDEEMRDPFTFIDAGWDFESAWGKSRHDENGGYMMLRSTGAGRLYDDYVRLVTPVEKTYGDSNPDLSSVATIVGRGDVTIEWGDLIDERTPVGTYTYSTPGVVDISTTSNGGAFIKLDGALTVNKAKLTVSVSDVEMTYTGNPFHGPELIGFIFDGFVNGENSSVLQGRLVLGGPAIGARNAGVYTMTVGGYTAKNYDIEYKDARLTIKPRPISLSGTRVYDRTRSLDASIFTLNNLVDGEELILEGTGLMEDRHAGNGKKVDLGTLQLKDGSDGTLASNYTLEGGEHTVDILPLEIQEILGIRAESKVYDGTTAATIDASLARLFGIYPEDDVAIVSAEGAFTSKDAGEGKTVLITRVMLGGEDALNYAVPNEPIEVKADIERLTLSVKGISVEAKPYDGTTKATLSGLGTLVGVLEGDEVQLDAENASAEFADAEPGTGKSVVVSGLALTGRDAGNYKLAPVTAVGVIAAPPSVEEPGEEPADELPAVPFLGSPLCRSPARRSHPIRFHRMGRPAASSPTTGARVISSPPRRLLRSLRPEAPRR